MQCSEGSLNICIGMSDTYGINHIRLYILTNGTHTSDWEFDLKGPTLRLFSFANTFFGVWEGLSFGVGPFPLSPSRLNSNRNETMN
jgi:hypothetical protein